MQTAPLLAADATKWADQQIYRSAIVPRDGRDGVLFDLWYTSVQKPNNWRISYTQIKAGQPRQNLARTDQPTKATAGQAVVGSSGKNLFPNPSLLLAASGAVVPTG